MEGSQGQHRCRANQSASCGVQPRNIAVLGRACDPRVFRMIVLCQFSCNRDLQRWKIYQVTSKYWLCSHFSIDLANRVGGAGGTWRYSQRTMCVSGVPESGQVILGAYTGRGPLADVFVEYILLVVHTSSNGRRLRARQQCASR